MTNEDAAAIAALSPVLRDLVAKVSAMAEDVRQIRLSLDASLPQLSVPLSHTSVSVSSPAKVVML